MSAAANLTPARSCPAAAWRASGAEPALMSTATIVASGFLAASGIVCAPTAQPASSTTSPAPKVVPACSRSVRARA